MSDQENRINLRMQNGQTVQIQDIAGAEINVTPQSQAFSVRWPNGGFIWNRPVAILVEQGGQIERVPIVDITRLVQIMLWGLSALFALGTVLIRIRNSRKEGIK